MVHPHGIKFHNMNCKLNTDHCVTIQPLQITLKGYTLIWKNACILREAMRVYLSGACHLSDWELQKFPVKGCSQKIA